MYDPLDEKRYSAGLRDLVKVILQREPEKRPSAAQVCEELLPPLLLGLSRLRLSVRRPRSVVYQCSPNLDKLEAVALPPMTNLAQLAVGPTHCLALNSGTFWFYGIYSILILIIMEKRQYLYFWN